MSDAPGKDTKVYLDAYDITGGQISVAREKSIAALDTTVLGLNSRRFIAGLKRGQFTLRGVYDDIGDGLNADVLDDILGTAKVISVVHGNTVPARGDGGDVKQAAYGLAEPVDGICAVSGTFSLKGPPYYAPLLQPKATKTETGEGTSREDAAQTTTGAVAIIHIGAVEGTPGSIVVKVQDSANDADWADVPGLTFTVVTTAGGADVVITSATETIDKYLRAHWTITTFTTCWIVVLCGRLT